MKHLLQTFIVIITLSNPLFAQKEKGNINGLITNIKGNPIEYINVSLLNTSIGGMTKSNGIFNLSAPLGKYILVVSGIGFETIKKEIEVQNDENLKIDFQLIESSTELQSVEVTGRKETDYKNEVSYIGSKSATALRDIPQSISYVTKELIQDQAAFRVNEIVKNLSGVNQFTFYNDLTIRGHRVNGNENYSMLVNGMRTFTSFWKQQLIPHIERVEVIKGPSSALFGNAAAGGSLNRVTKKPLDEKRQSINFSTGSFGTFRTTADFTGPLDDKKTLLYRLNVGYENSGSFRDLQFEKNIIIAPSFSFLPSEKTRVNFDAVYQNTDSRLDRGQAVTGSGDLFSVPISKSLNRVNDYLKEDAYSATVSLNHRFSKAISFTSSYMRSSYSEDLLEHRTSNAYAKDATGKLIDDQVEMQVFVRKRTWNNDNFSSYFNIDFNLGKLENKIVVGYDYAQETVATGGSQLTAGGYRNAANTGTIATFVPANIKNYLLDAKGNPVPNVAHFNLSEEYPYFLADMSKYFFARRDFPPSFYSSQGIYLQDQIKFGKLQAILGIRQDIFTDLNDYKTSKEKEVVQKALIPRLGLVYSINSKINAYATFVKGYQPQTSATIANVNTGGPFDPLYSSLMEGGLKTEWFGKRLTANLSVYELMVDGALYNAGVAGQPELLTQIGQEVSKGFEVDLLGQIATNWNILVTYAYNDATITKSKNEAEIGRQKPNAPKHQGSFWTKYVVNKGKLSGLGFGLGANFVTDRLGSIVATGQVPQAIPAYELVNGALYYQVSKFKIQVNANNLTNKTHWVGGYDKIRMFPGTPRNFLITVGYSI